MPLLVGTTVDNYDEATKIAESCVERGIAACAHIDEIESIYMWKGKVTKGKEFRLFLKTTEQAYPQVAEVIKAHHSYDEPALFTIPITGGSPSYLQWIKDCSEHD